MLLPESFYQREDVLTISRELLGKFLVAETESKRTVGMIVETEAYRAPEDKACHAYGNRRTARTEVMFAAGGIAYVYLCYGIHHLFNVVTGLEGQAHAVLIRAVEPVEGINHMLMRREMDKPAHRLTGGPGMFTQAMGIHTGYNGISLLSESSPIRIEDHGYNVFDKDIVSGPRVGVASSGECANWPWRFRIRGNPWPGRAEPVY